MHDQKKTGMGAATGRSRHGLRLKTMIGVFAFLAAGQAQTTHGLLSGRLLNSRTGRPIAAATVFYASLATNASGTARTDKDGQYSLPLLSPGLYRLRASASGYQDQELYNLNVPVAGRLEVDLRLRPLSDVWEGGQYRSVFLAGSKTVVTFYGPDVDSSRSGSFEAQSGQRGALVSTLSQVIDPAEVRDLPLAGRDVYTMLLTQPGITADSGTSRGLGLSATGQRPSASNFFLDGVENSNYLVTGPLMAIAPEAIQEYRVSTSNYSAQYGRTSGYLANAVTRSGGNQFHGVGYFYGMNDALNASDFQDNRLAHGRTPVSEQQFGFQAGGPIRRERLFFSTSFEQLRSRSNDDPITFPLPAPGFAANFTAPGSNARKLLEQYPAPVVTPDPRLPWQGNLTVSPPVTVDRSLALERIDYHRGADQVMGRIAIARLARPDFLWYPYSDFISGLTQNTISAAIVYQRALRAGLTNEAKFAYSSDHLEWDRKHPEVPTLFSGDGVILPGSPAFYAYKNHTQSWQAVDNLIWLRGRHLLTFGGGLLLNRLDGFLTAGRDGQYLFQNLVLFGADLPSLFAASVERGSNRQPDFDRRYRYLQSYFFAQDAFRTTPRLTLNYGLRYERFGAPDSVGSTKEMLVALGPGSALPERIAGARLVSGGKVPYGTDNRDWALRVGASYDLGHGRTTLRGSYGIFYDRPFDNLWQNVRSNSFVVPIFTVTSQLNYLAPIGSALSAFPSVPPTDFPDLTVFDPNLRNGYATNYFYGVQQRLSEDWSLEVNGIGSLGRRLITTDVVNRQFTTAISPGRLNPELPNLVYRAGQGFSNYQGLATVTSYRGRRGQFQLAYTWSHSIDNESEVLAGDAFDLSFTRISSAGSRSIRSTFSRQFDNQADRGSSDFDQRHNLTFFSVWRLPWRWRFSQLAAFRSGFPYSVYASGNDFPVMGQGLILNNRADLIAPSDAVLKQRTPIDGGFRLLNPGAFANPPAGRLGTSGRNAFPGPGLYNLDVSLSRSFKLPLGEAGSLTLRADAYNFLNHANLSNPHPFLGSGFFGDAVYGRHGRPSGFPSVTPFVETARRVQLMVRVEW